jgi:hypothetical protein
MAAVRFLVAIAGLALSGSVLGLLASDAAAQAVGTGNVIVDRVERTVADHDQAVRYHISQADCLSADATRFPYTLSNLDGVLSFEVWLGEGSANCADLGARNGSGDQAQCRPVHEIGDPEDDGEIVITSRSIAETGLGYTNCVDEGDDTEPHNVSLFFMLIRDVALDVPAEDYAQWTETKVDLLGPKPPDSITLIASDEAIEVEYEVDAGQEDTSGYRFYCDDGTLAATDATASSSSTGTSTATGGGDGGGGAGGGDGGAAASTTATSTSTASTGSTSAETGSGGGEGSSCVGNALVEGGTVDPAWRSCGSVDDGATPSGVATGLENGTTYAVAVVAVDDLGNVGKLSEVECAEPFPVDDFYELYRAAGGEAGGGFCSLTEVGAPIVGRALAALGVAGAGLALAMRRRRRRRAR